MISFIRPAFAAAALVFASSLNAETLVQYDFTGGGLSSQRNVSSSGTNVTTAAFEVGSGVSIDRSTVNSSGGSGNYRSIFAKPSTVNEPISTESGDWLGFTISATSGNLLNLTDLKFDYAYSYNSNPRPETPAVFDVHFSVDNWATSTSIEVFSQSAPAGMGSIVWEHASIGLSASSFQGLESISFRIFLNDGDNENDASYLRLDAVSLSGLSSNIPEPSTYALIVGAGGLLVAGLRHRRNRAG